MPFRIALSGLEAASTNLQVTGNNIANASTTGFKESRVEFSDLYSTSLQDVSSTGKGAKVSRVAQQFSQGNIELTSNAMDLAISGEGFFVVKDNSGAQSYTRAGEFTVDRDGYVVNARDQALQVYGAQTSASGTTFNTGVLTDLKLPTSAGSPSPSSSITAALNLDASQSAPSVGVFDAADPNSYNQSNSITVYDSLGNAHTATMYFAKTAANTWDSYLYLDGTAAANNVLVTAPGVAPEAAQLVFDSSGALTTPASGSITFQAEAVTGGGADLALTIDFSETTQYGAPFAVNSLTQDGYASGELSGLDIEDSGVVYARFTNGQSQALGKVALARFNNVQGLRQLGAGNWAQSFSSGDVQLGEAGTSSFGLIQSGSRENSNVDIAEQLVLLIAAQRDFQANSQVISTADTVTQTIINIR